MIISFADLNERIARAGLRPVPYAYKLCDYKPFYGNIFSEYVKGYEYWGYCDVDTVFGDIPGYLERIGYRAYDRIGEKGHFTIYRTEVDTLRLALDGYNKELPHGCDVHFVERTAYPCHFDESGMNRLCELRGLRYFAYNDVLQTTICHEVHLHTFRAKCRQLMTYEEGHIFLYEETDGGVERREFMYIHFQDKKQMPVLLSLEVADRFLITHEGFLPFEPSRLDEYFRRYGGFDTPEESARYHQALKKKRRKDRIGRLRREFATYPLRAFYNIYCRWRSVRWLKAHGLF